MKLGRYISRRLGIMLIQLIGIIVITFFLNRLLPGDPVQARLGPLATPEAKAMLTAKMGLDKPLHIQFVRYVSGLLQGDLGNSWRTGNPVLKDILQRFPTTFELITWAMISALVIGVAVGAYAALHPNGFVDRSTLFYSLLAGAMPDFYIGLVLIFVFFYLLGIAPAPMGRIDVYLSRPPTVTGSYIIDGMLAGDWQVAKSAAAHLVLPVATLAFVYTGAFLKMTRSTMRQMFESDFMHYARINGLPRAITRQYGLKTTLPPVVNLFGMIYAFVLGAAVLIETVFGLAGLGQYSVQSIVSADYEALSGFMLVAAVFYLIIYLLVDIIQAFLDPRIRY
jgi:peptide/nickel transport system permease protein